MYAKLFTACVKNSAKVGSGPASSPSRQVYKVWVSCYKFTVFVAVDKATDKITDTAPIVKRFIGQPFSNLERWMKTLGGYEWADL